VDRVLNAAGGRTSGITYAAQIGRIDEMLGNMPFFGVEPTSPAAGGGALHVASMISFPTARPPEKLQKYTELWLVFTPSSSPSRLDSMTDSHSEQMTYFVP